MKTLGFLMCGLGIGAALEIILKECKIPEDIVLGIFCAALVIGIVILLYSFISFHRRK